MAKPQSIREFVLNGLKAQLPQDEMVKALGQLFPGTGASKQPVKHIAWYRGWLRKHDEEFRKADDLRRGPPPFFTHWHGLLTTDELNHDYDERPEWDTGEWPVDYDL